MHFLFFLSLLSQSLVVLMLMINLLSCASKCTCSFILCIFVFYSTEIQTDLAKFLCVYSSKWCKVLTADLKTMKHNLTKTQFKCRLNNILENGTKEKGHKIALERSIPTIRVITGCAHDLVKVRTC